MIGPFYIGQIPLGAIAWKCQTQLEVPVDLTVYTGFQLLMRNADGTLIDTSAGTLAMSPTDHSVVIYDWPTTSLFTKTGRIKFQLRLYGTGVNDLSAVGEFDVFDSLV